MNYHALSRRELQALCKQHKIPANKTNVFMADSLTALLSVSFAEVNLVGFVGQHLSSLQG